MGTMTINTTAGEDTRLVAAFGKRLGLGRNATAPEVKAAIIQMIKNAAQEQEVNTAVQAAADGVTVISPT
jgi:hypothetical protein